VEHTLADGEVESHHGLYWKRDGVLEEPRRKMPKTIGRLKPEFVNNFGTPLDSIMSIFPLIYWKIISHEMNEDAHMKLEQQFDTTGKRTISGSRWTHDTAFREILQFYRVLMMMILFPLPGATYTAYWSYGSPMFPRTNTIALRRFKQLRSALHFNLNATEAKGKDALHQTRPFLNIVKKTLGVFIIPGSEMSLDEASCASRSNYGRELIFFNPKKNCGKFHFRFYLLCDASTLVCLTLKVPTRNYSDPADPEETFTSIQQEANYSLLNKLVLEMCRKYNHTFRTENMDNYYTPPAILIFLHNCGIYARGTVKKNRRMVPSQINLTKADCKKQLMDMFKWMFVNLQKCKLLAGMAILQFTSCLQQIHPKKEPQFGDSVVQPNYKSHTHVQFLCTMMG
jgi:hypothetical protein